MTEHWSQLVGMTIHSQVELKGAKHWSNWKEHKHWSPAWRETNTLSFELKGDLTLPPRTEGRQTLVDMCTRELNFLLVRTEGRQNTGSNWSWDKHWSNWRETKSLVELKLLTIHWSNWSRDKLLVELKGRLNTGAATSKETNTGRTEGRQTLVTELITVACIDSLARTEGRQTLGRTECVWKTNLLVEFPEVDS